MRKLKASDIAPFTKIIAKMEIKDAIKGLFNKIRAAQTIEKEVDATPETGENDIVIELVWGVIENYHKAEKEFFAFLGNIEDRPPEEIADLDIPAFIELLKELFSEDNLSFFKSAAK